MWQFLNRFRKHLGREIDAPYVTIQGHEPGCQIPCANPKVKYLHTAVYTSGSHDFIQDLLISVEWEATMILD